MHLIQIGARSMWVRWCIMVVVVAGAIRGQVAFAQLARTAVQELLAEREQIVRDFAVQCRFERKFKSDTAGSQDPLSESHTGEFLFRQSKGETRAHGHWAGEGIEQHFEADFREGICRFIRTVGGHTSADFTAEASDCFPDGIYPLNFVVCLQGRPLSSLLDMFEIRDSGAAGVVLLESPPRTSLGATDERMGRLEFDESHNYALRRIVGFVRIGGEGDWVVGSETVIDAWYSENHGVCLPESATHRHYSWDDIGPNHISRTYLVSESKVRFENWRLGITELEELIIPAGTMVMDRVHGDRFVTRDVTDQDIADAGSHSAIKNDAGHYTWWIAVSCIVLTAFLAFWVGMRRSLK